MVMCSLTAFCQATQEGIGSVEFPESTSKINKDKAIEHIKAKFDNDQVLLKTVPLRRSEHQYIIKDVLITLYFSRIGSGMKIDLKQRKTGDDLLFGREKDYKSEIKNIDGNQVYITNRMASGNIERYNFLVYKADGTKAITGSLDFQKNNKEAAKNILDHILTHAKFKD